MTEGKIKDMVIKNFDKYDTSGDGNLDQHELTKFFEDILKRREDGHKYNAMDLAKTFLEKLDRDGDMKLSR
jgi:hypothetical protein